MAEKQYFSLPAAARELGVSTDLLRVQYRTGCIPAITTPGGQPRFSSETIETIKQDGWPQAAPPGRQDPRNPQPRTPTPPKNGRLGPVSRFSASPKQPEALDFRGMRTEEVRLFREPEQRPNQPEQFRRKWNGHANQLLPYWLTPEERNKVSRQIESEINRRTSEDEPRMGLLCGDIVRSALQAVNQQRLLSQARDLALNRVLAKIPSDTTYSERMQAETLARRAIQQADDEGGHDAFFAAAWNAVAPIFAVVELRRQREELRAWGLQKVPRQATEKEQRDGRAAINKVIEQMSGEQDETTMRDKLEEALEPVLAAIQRRIEEERRRQLITGPLSTARLHVGTYLQTLYAKGEIDYAAICDWEWRQEMERAVAADLQRKLRGDESNEELRELVEEILEDQLEEEPDNDD
jgi:hypothetical protein